MRASLTRSLLAGCLFATAACAAQSPPGLLVLQTDFGLRDQAVAAMRGVIRGVDPRLVVDDLTHEVPAFNVWEAAYRLSAVMPYWPEGSVFVSVVDPGVGTGRASVVARLATGQLVVTPDNGTLTLLAESPGITAVRTVDETAQRLPGSERSHTFHGRDLYAYVGARLASGQLAFDRLGELRETIVEIPYQRAARTGNHLQGTVPVLDPQYGNIWTNIEVELLDQLGVAIGSSVAVLISEADSVRFQADVAFQNTFGDVPPGTPLLYVNSVGRLALALNQASFASRYDIQPGPDTQVTITASGPAE